MQVCKKIHAETFASLSLNRQDFHISKVFLRKATFNGDFVCVCVCVCTHMCVCSLCHVQLCDPMGCSSPGSSVHGIFQARILEWISVSESYNYRIKLYFPVDLNVYW